MKSQYICPDRPESGPENFFEKFVICILVSCNNILYY